MDVDWLPNAEAGGFDATEKAGQLIDEISAMKAEMDERANRVDEKLKALVAARAV